MFLLFFCVYVLFRLMEADGGGDGRRRTVDGAIKAYELYLVELRTIICFYVLELCVLLCCVCVVCFSVLLYVFLCMVCSVFFSLSKCCAFACSLLCIVCVFYVLCF